jgi:hypothetical protein
MKSYKLSELQSELRAKGIPELSEKLKRETGYDPVARKLRRNPREAKAAYGARRTK